MTRTVESGNVCDLNKFGRNLLVLLCVFFRPAREGSPAIEASNAWGTTHYVMEWWGAGATPAEDQVISRPLHSTVILSACRLVILSKEAMADVRRDGVVSVQKAWVERGAWQTM